MNILKQETMSPKITRSPHETIKLTELHYMFCGTPVEEHCSKLQDFAGL